MFEQKKISEIFNLDPAKLPSDRLLDVVDGNSGKLVESPKPYFGFNFEDVVCFTEYLERPYTGLPLVIESVSKGGKTEFPRQACLRLKADYQYFDMRLMAVDALLVKLEALYSESVNKVKGKYVVIHLDNVDGLSPDYLKRVCDLFVTKFINKFKVVLSAEGESSVELKTSRRLFLTPLDANAVLSVIYNYVNVAYQLDQAEMARVTLLSKTIVDVFMTQKGFVPIDLALSWLVEGLTMLHWKLGERNVCLESIRVLQYCMEHEELEALSDVTKQIIEEKLQQAHAA